MAYIGKKIKEKYVARIENELSGFLDSDEKVVAVFWANRLKPLTDTIVFTNRRFLCAQSSYIGKAAGFFNEIVADDISQVDIEKSFTGPRLVITRSNGVKELIAVIVKDDFENMVRIVEKMSGSPKLINYAEQKQAKVIAAAEQKLGIKIVPKEELGSRLKSYSGLVIGHANKPTLQEAIALSKDGEAPEFIIGELNAGALIAFKNRCSIVKKGIGTSFLAGSLGGGRVATFAYSDITAIEYNSGMATGVLEILTPSYQGTKNKDFWSGTFSSRNSNSNDPYTLSNTLPLSRALYSQARSKIEWLQEMVQQAKAPSTVVTGPTDDLSKLAQLHKQGALTDSEFNLAKQKLISKL